jgi:hypothetical protein
VTLSIGDLPFRAGDPVEVLRLDRFDPDYGGTGYCHLDRVWLESRGGGEPARVANALVLALHSPEEPEALDDDIELEFYDQGVTVLLSKFLAGWLPRIAGGEHAVVLALCNPRAATVAAPAAAAGVPVWYALGDVESWLDEDEGGRRVRLVADAWRLAG